ncbi:MAG: GAF domain-containing protein, partial [Dehalococcoidia bacterium]
EMAETFAAHAALALQNARLHESTQNYAAQIALVDEVSSILTGTLNIEEVYERFAQEVKRLVDFDQININILEPDTDHYAIKYIFGPNYLHRRAGDLVPLAGSQTEQATTTGKTIIREDISGDIRYTRDPQHVEAGMYSSIVVPLVSKGKAVGTLNLRDHRVGAYGRREQAILERLASQIAPAVENARLYQDLQASSAEMAVVDGVARIITTTLNIDEVYEQFALETKKLVDFDRIAINVVDPEAESFVFRYVSGLVWRNRRSGDVLPLAGTQTQHVITTRQPLLRSDVAEDIRFVGDSSFLEAGMRSTILVPLVSQGRFIGTLSLRSQRVDAYGPREQTILERLASQIAPALENAGLYEETRAEQQRAADALAQLQESQEALRKSEEKYRSLFEQSRDAIYFRDREGWFIDVNQATVDLFGYTRQELMAMNIIDLCADSESRLEFQEEIEKTGSVRDLETRFCRKDGAELECLLSATVRRGPDGSVLGYEGIIHDVTERRQLEVQFLQSQKMESLGRLAGGIAHDFNNLLAGILGFASLLRSKLEPTSENYEFAQIIEKATQRGSQLTQQLLTAARKGPFEARPMDVNETTQEVVQILSHTLSKDITIVSRFQSNLPLIQGDMNQIHQVLLNLCINASDAMPNGGTLTLANQSVHLDEDFCRQHLSLEPGQYVQVSVSDTGEGIGEADRSKIFEPFFTTKESGKGTGLGLSVVYGIVKNHRGTVEVHSERGQGSTFTVYLPVLRVASRL